MQTEEQIIKEAYRKVSDDVKYIIASSEWVKRVREIGQKYSLTQAQIDALGYEVLFTFLNIQSAELLNETIEEELEISSVLAEQIMEEVEERVFTWAVKKIEQKNSPSASTNSLDIPPPNLPGEVIEEIEAPLAVEPPITPTPEVITETKQEEVSPTHISTPEVPLVAPQEKINSVLQDQVKNFFTPRTPEVAQEKPIFTFKPSPITEPQAPAQPIPPVTAPISKPVTPVSTPVSPQPSFISNKLSQPTKAQTPPSDIPKTYTVDPYREPVE